MSKANIVCMFCCSKAGNIILLSNETLKKCNQVLKWRKNSNLTQKDVVLPQKVNDFEGYHRKCYQKFTAVQKNIEHMKMNLQISQNHRHLMIKCKFNNIS